MPMESDSLRVGMPGELVGACPADLGPTASDISAPRRLEENITQRAQRPDTPQRDDSNVTGSRSSLEKRDSRLLDESALAGDTAPDATLFNPGVGEADAMDVFLAFAG